MASKQNAKIIEKLVAGLNVRRMMKDAAGKFAPLEPQMAELMGRASDLNEAASCGIAPLGRALAAGDEEAAKALVECGADFAVSCSGVVYLLQTSDAFFSSACALQESWAAGSQEKLMKTYLDRVRGAFGGKGIGSLFADPCADRLLFALLDLDPEGYAVKALLSQHGELCKSYGAASMDGEGEHSKFMARLEERRIGNFAASAGGVEGKNFKAL